jgi:hypothetical protein
LLSRKYAVALAKALLKSRPCLAIGLPHLFEGLAVVALGTAAHSGVVGVG